MRHQRSLNNAFGMAFGSSSELENELRLVERSRTLLRSVENAIQYRIPRFRPLIGRREYEAMMKVPEAKANLAEAVSLYRGSLHRRRFNSTATPESNRPGTLPTVEQMFEGNGIIAKLQSIRNQMLDGKQVVVVNNMVFEPSKHFNQVVLLLREFYARFFKPVYSGPVRTTEVSQ